MHENEILSLRVETQEETFRHISREIHDNIGQKLTLAKLYSIQASESTEKMTNENVTSLLTETIADLRELSKLFNADIILNEGLVKAIQYATDLIKKAGEYKISLSVNEHAYFVDKDIELVIYRISQEALNNIIKHSGANEIKIEINYLPESLEMIIRDNGKGYQNVEVMSSKELGSGILNMQARAERMNGIFFIEGIPNVGTKVTVKIPIKYETI